MPSTSGNLYLQLSANTDIYVQALKAAKASTASFAGDVDAQIAGVQDALEKLSGANGVAVAKQMEASFRSSFNNIRAVAEQSLTLPKTDAGALSINLVGAEQASADAERVAIAYREVADAAARVVIGNDEATEAEKRNAVAAEARAQAAEAVVGSTRQEVAALQSLQRELDAAGASAVESAVDNDTVVGSHQRMGASGLIADHVIRSFADSVTAGQSPVRAFALELPRITEAMQFMSQGAQQGEGALSKFANLMSGGFGIAITAAVAVASVLAGTLLDGKDAANADATAHDALKDAVDRLNASQAALNHTTRQGIVDDLNAAEAARQKAVATRQGLQAQLQSQLAFKQAATDQLSEGAGSEGSGPIISDATSQVDSLKKQLADNQAEINKANTGILTGATKLIQRDVEAATDPRSKISQAFQDRSDSLDRQFQSGKINAQTYRDQYTQATTTRDSDLEAFQQSQRNPRSRKPKADHSAEKAATQDRSYQNEDRTVSDALAKAQAELAGTVEARYQVQLAELQKDLASQVEGVQDEVTAHKRTAAEGAALIAKLKETEADKEILLQRQKEAELIDQRLQAEQLGIDGAKALLELSSSLATTTKRRRDIALQQLALDEQSQRANAQAELAKATTQAQRDNATTKLNQIDQQHDGKVAEINQTNAQPLAAYSTQLHKATDDMNEALQGVAVDGLKNLEDGFAGVITGTETVGQAFKKMAQSIIADLAKIAIEKAIVGALGGSGGILGSLFGHADGGQIQAHAAGGVISGPGGPRSDSILSWVSNGEFIMNAASTQKYLPMLHAMNDNRLPAFADGGLVGSLTQAPTMRDLSPDDIRSVSRSGSAGNPINIDLRGAVMTADLIQQMQQISIATGGQVLTTAVDHTNRSIADLSRQRL